MCFRQFYLFATDSRVKRMGMQSWIYVAVCALEGAICVKFGRDQFSHINLTYICLWIAGMVIYSNLHFSDRFLNLFCFSFA